MEKYLPIAEKRNARLPGMGGVFNSVNLGLYTYAGNKPVNFYDPDGNVLKGLARIGDELIEAAQKSVRIVNKRYAGTTHPVTGIPYNSRGFPDFSSVAKETVTIKPTGDRAMDFSRANEAAGLKETPEGYTWHHVEDTTTMQLVPTDIHDATRHTGGIAVLKRAVALSAATVSTIASDIANASTADVIGFTADMITPLGLESKDLGGGIDMMDPSQPPPMWEGLSPLPADWQPPAGIEGE